MALKQYKSKVSIANDIFYTRPRKAVLPIESHKYIETKWISSYSFFRLAYMIYGTASLYWLIMDMNDITDPLSVEEGDSLRILLPDFLNEVAVP